MGELSVIHQAPTRTGAIQLLESGALPTSDLTDAHMAHFFYVGTASAPRAIVGVEFCGPDALLRSLVVAPELRTSGLGSKLVEHAESHARAQGARAVYLLTTTAEQFFRSRGYRVVPRGAAPPDVRSTTEFSGLCPASSAFMSKNICDLRYLP